MAVHQESVKPETLNLHGAVDDVDQVVQVVVGQSRHQVLQQE